MTRRRDAGFSLIEVVCASLLIGVIAAATIQLLSSMVMSKIQLAAKINAENQLTLLEQTLSHLTQEATMIEPPSGTFTACNNFWSVGQTYSIRLLNNVSSSGALIDSTKPASYAQLCTIVVPLSGAPGNTEEIYLYTGPFAGFGQPLIRPWPFWGSGGIKCGDPPLAGMTRTRFLNFPFPAWIYLFFQQWSPNTVQIMVKYQITQVGGAITQGVSNGLYFAYHGERDFWVVTQGSYCGLNQF